MGLDLSDELQLNELEVKLNQFLTKTYCAEPLLLDYVISEREAKPVINPANKNDTVGEVLNANLMKLVLRLTMP